MVLLIALTSLLAGAHAPGNDCASPHAVVRPAQPTDGNSSGWRSFEASAFEEEEDDDKKLVRPVPAPAWGPTCERCAIASLILSLGASFSDAIESPLSGGFPAVLRVSISLGLSRGPPSRA